jgi:hypothetical protein
MQYIGFAIKGFPYMGVGRNLAYTKKFFLENNGFQPYVYLKGGDDDLLIQKLANKNNTAVNIHIDSQTVSIPKKTWGSYFKQKRRHLYIGKYYRRSIKYALGLLNTSHLGFYVFLTLSFLSPESSQYAIFLLLLRFISVMWVFRTVAKKLRYDINVFKSIVFDVLYPLYYVIMGTIAFFTKKVSWK